MSYLLLTNSGAPATPAANKGLIYIDSTGRLKKITSDGVVTEPGDHELGNLLRNSGFWFAQRQAPATLTTYTNAGGRILSADGWGISNENASTQYRRVDTSGAPESGLQGQFYGEFTKLTTTGKIQVSQVVEGKDMVAVRGRTVRFQMWAKAIIGTPITLKMGVIQLAAAGTVDTVPSGAGLFLSASGANGVDPTLGTNLAWLAPKAGVTPDNATAQTNNVTCNATTTWQRFSFVVDVPTTAKNLVVMVWTDNQVIATNGFAISQVSLTDGYEIQNWTPLSYDSELARVMRYYQKTFAVDTAPIQNAGVATGALRCILGKAGIVALAAQFQWRYQVNLRIAAVTLTTYNPAAANAAVRQVGGTAADLTATATANSTEQSVDVTATGVTAGAVGDQCGVHVTADAEL